jgi:ubiquinone/menaquinone biosynthesis C-methylase UbiE
MGSGIGVHALPIASSLAPDGVLDVLDVQQEMLNDLVHRATQAGITNIVSTQGDARKLPYPDSSFDGAYLISVLGEIPDQEIALQELRRVLKPNARLVIGEIFIDPDFVSLSELQHRMSRAGFAFERKIGLRWVYLARFKAT